MTKEQNKWQVHPNKKRKYQKIAFVDTIGCNWRNDDIKMDAELKACVVHDTKSDEYFVFVTTNLKRMEKQIIQTCELRPKSKKTTGRSRIFGRLTTLQV